MLAGVDTTFLVQAEVLESPGHAQARAFLRRVVDQSDRLGLAAQVLTEFVHVVTDPRRFSRPLEVFEAVTRARFWWRAKEIQQVQTTPEAVELFFDWMQQHRLGRKRILDTQLAATYRAAGLARIVSSNARDFHAYGFEVILVDGTG